MAWAAGGCIRCAGDGTVDIPAVYRGSLLIRPGRRLPCPECGGRVRHLEVVELPRAEWFQGLKTAGDLGAGWRPDQWGEVLAGGDPDGYRFSDGDRLEPGAGSP